MSSNIIIVIGNVGKQGGELRYLPTGTAVLNFSLAVNKNWVGNDGQRQQKTTWFKCAFFGERAEKVAQYVTTGKQLQVVGEAEEPEAYINRDNKPTGQNKITVRDLVLLGGNGNGNSGNVGHTDEAQQHQPEVNQEVNPADIPF